MSSAWCAVWNSVVICRESTGQMKRPTAPAGATVLVKPFSGGAATPSAALPYAVVAPVAAPPAGAIVAPAVEPTDAAVIVGPAPAGGPAAAFAPDALAVLR